VYLLVVCRMQYLFWKKQGRRNLALSKASRTCSNAIDQACRMQHAHSLLIRGIDFQFDIFLPNYEKSLLINFEYYCSITLFYRSEHTRRCNSVYKFLYFINIITLIYLVLKNIIDISTYNHILITV